MIKEIVQVPDLILGRKAHKVRRQNIDFIRTVSKDLLDTVKSHQGLGLAAPQINIGLRMMVVDLSPTNQNYAVFVNPEIYFLSEEKETKNEMCLSIPGMVAPIPRSKVINLRWDGGSRAYTGWVARIIQHEYDHLQGILLFDRSVV